MTTSTFYTIFWIFYFPLCIAYNDLPNFSYLDEVMTVILMAYTFLKMGSKSVNNKPCPEYFTFLGILAFYVIYSLIRKVNVAESVWMDLVQQIRPYSVLFCTWILAPRFSRTQKHLMLFAMIATLFSWIIYHPAAMDTESEFPVLGQLAICTGMSYYLFSKETKRNRWIALTLVCTGLLAPKMKFVGEVVCFIAVVFFLKRKLNIKSSKTIVFLGIIISLCVILTWTRFDAYYVSGWSDENKARPMTYKTSIQVLKDYGPFGPGMGTFATNAAWKVYSPLYYKYGLNKVWGLDEGGGFICDAYYPSLAEFGIVGVLLFLVFWKRRLKNLSAIQSIRFYHVGIMAFFCLAIESVADSSYLSGKGMGYFMLLGLCLNANRTLLLSKPKRTKSRLPNQK